MTDVHNTQHGKVNRRLLITLSSKRIINETRRPGEGGGSRDREKESARMNTINFEVNIIIFFF